MDYGENRICELRWGVVGILRGSWACWDRFFLASAISRIMFEATSEFLGYFVQNTNK
jgi:hypothetical protein